MHLLPFTSELSSSSELFFSELSLDSWSATSSRVSTTSSTSSILGSLFAEEIYALISHVSDDIAGMGWVMCLRIKLGSQ